MSEPGYRPGWTQCSGPMSEDKTHGAKFSVWEYNCQMGRVGDHFSVTSVLSKAFRDSRASHNPGMSTHTGDARFVAPRFSNLTFTSLTWSVLRVFLLKVYQVSNFKMALNYFPVARLKYRRGYGFRDSMIRL